MSMWIRVGVVVGFVSCVAMGDSGKKEYNPLKTWSKDAREVVDRMVKTVKTMDSYQGEGWISYENPFDGYGSVGYCDTGEWKEYIVYSRSKGCRIETERDVLISDGKNITVAFGEARRYRTRPMEKNESIQELYSYVARSPVPGVASIYLSEDPLSTFSERVWNLDVTGHEIIDGDACVMLSFQYKDECKNMIPAMLWMREKDGLIRQLEIDHTESIKEAMNSMLASFAEDEGGDEEVDEWLVQWREEERKERQRLEDKLNSGERAITRFDSGTIQINHKVKETAFQYKPEERFKKAEWIFHPYYHFETTAVPCELSGERLPDFEMIDLEGNAVSSDMFKRGVGLLVVAPVNVSYAETVDDLSNQLRCSYHRFFGEIYELIAMPGHGLTIATLVPTDTTGRSPLGDEKKLEVTPEVLRQVNRSIGFPGRCAIDEDSVIARKLKVSNSAVLLVKDGVVQGTYTSQLDAGFGKWLRSDVDLLRKGKTLRAAKAMTRKDIRERAAQIQAFVYSMYSIGEESGSEEINRERLVEAWSFPVSRMTFGWNSQKQDSEFWVFLGDTCEYVNADGQVEGSIRLPEEVYKQFSSVNRMDGDCHHYFGIFGPGGQPATLRVKFRGDSNSSMNHFMFFESEPQSEDDLPSGMYLSLWNQAGEHVWDLGLECSVEYPDSDSVFFGDLDGKYGDEIVVKNNGILYVIHSSGELLCSRKISTGVGSVVVLDRDQDGKGELYLKGYGGLARYDYVTEATN